MREIVLDTETTGLKPEEGHRIIEIGAIEIINYVPTGEVYHVYINPQMEIAADATEVHGMTQESLKDKPVFAEIADDFIKFIGDAPLVIHNAPFDMGFINEELKRLGKKALPMERATDTLEMARRKFPGAQASLDALCKRFNIDTSAREKHTAIIDARLLAEVYVELQGGRDPTLTLDAPETPTESASATETPTHHSGAIDARPHAASEEELKAHATFVKELKNPLWKA